MELLQVKGLWLKVPQKADALIQAQSHSQLQPEAGLVAT